MDGKIFLQREQCAEQYYVKAGGNMRADHLQRRGKMVAYSVGRELQLFSNLFVGKVMITAKQEHHFALGGKPRRRMADAGFQVFQQQVFVCRICHVLLHMLPEGFLLLPALFYLPQEIERLVAGYGEEEGLQVFHLPHGGAAVPYFYEDVQHNFFRRFRALAYFHQICQQPVAVTGKQLVERMLIVLYDVADQLTIRIVTVKMFSFHCTGPVNLDSLGLQALIG